MSKTIFKTTLAQRAQSARQYAKIKKDPIRIKARNARARQRRKNNPEKYRMTRNQWIANNYERHLEHVHRANAKNRKYISNWSRIKRAANHLPILVNSARQRAKVKGIPCTITVDTCPPVPTHCPVLGILFNRNNRSHSPTLDRINPSLGYIPGNVRWISHRWNRMKSDHTLETARLLVRDLEGLT